MDEGAPTPELQDEPAVARARRRHWPRVLGVFVLLLLAALVVLYFSRERLARDLIEEQLAALDLPATYEVEEIGAERQVLTNLVIGDPAAPDLTIERVELQLVHRFGFPDIGRITVVKPRLYGGWKDGRLSFGSLDKFIYAESDDPPGLPEYDIALIDGRARLETPYGVVGIKAEGEGPLDDGFAGMIAATAPELAVSDCRARDATLYGQVSVDGGRPSFDGPLRFASLRCGAANSSLGKTAIAVDALGDADLAGVEASLSSDTAALAVMGQTARSAALTGDVTWRDERLTADYDIGLANVAAGGFALAGLNAEGMLRGSDGFERIELQARIEGDGMRGDAGLDDTLASLISSSEGTLAAPLLSRFRSGLSRELRSASFALDTVVRKTGAVTTGIIPEARLRGGSGDTLLALSRLQFSTAGSGAPRISANIATGGRDLPRITGRMERRAGGTPVFRLAMANYSAGGASLAIPRLNVLQDARGAYLFDGQIAANGPLPGGSAQNLRVPVDGRWDAGSNGGGALALWRGCTPVTFDRLEYADLTLAGQSLTLCPPSGRAIVSQQGGALRIAAGVPSLNLSGSLGATPMTLRSGAIGFAYPGALAASDLDIALGPRDSAARFRISDLTAQFGSDIAGTFADADLALDAIPLDLRETSGAWRYAGGRLTIDDATFTLEDRAEVARFEPLAGRGASLSLENNMILAEAVLQTPDSGREIAALDIRHDLSTGTGSADLDVAGITFDEGLQAGDLTYLARGVVANVRGVVTGSGEIEWNADAVTSRGAFSSDNLDLAAAFGPVRGASGTVEFTDLIGLTTAPNQRIYIDSVNPGIEVVDGSLDFRIENGELLEVQGGVLTFAGGKLVVRPVQIRIGEEEVRRYLFEVVGLDSALFVERLELSNIGAQGIFDGVLPLIFDAQGNGRIEEGVLVSRAPGGNISYVGELTYEDMGAMANFAFDALRSLDYEQMTVKMDGPLTGELVTRTEFTGVTQGAGASRNIITRQLGRIPLEFRVNIRAPFSKLIASLAAISDPASVRDPRDLGLLGADGRRLRRTTTDEEAEALIAEREAAEAGRTAPNKELPVEPPVQGEESEEMP